METSADEQRIGGKNPVLQTKVMIDISSSVKYNIYIDLSIVAFNAVHLKRQVQLGKVTRRKSLFFLKTTDLILKQYKGGTI